MAFTIDTVVSRAREILQDAEKDRYADQRLVDGLNLAITDMMRIRPDIPSLQTTIPNFPYKAADLGQSVLVPFNQKYMSPVVAYVAGWVELADDEFAVDNRAVSLLMRFQTQLVVGG